MKLAMNLAPLRTSRDFRYLMGSGGITMVGNFATFVAVSVQIKQLTGSPVAVGMVAAAEFVPVVLFGLYGGALADALDRRRTAVLCELGLLLTSTLLLLNAALPHPLLWPIYLINAVAAALDSVQRPSLDGLIPRYVAHDQLAAAAAIRSAKWNIGAIAGPALAGLLVSAGGPGSAYALDVVTFGFSLVLLLRLSPAPAPADARPAGLSTIAEGIRYAAGRRELVGTYLIDIVAMTFAMPQALYPFLADQLHSPGALGLLFSAGAVGSLVASVASGWAGSVHRHGLAIALAAAIWGAAVTLAGSTTSLALVLVALTVAGAADMVSGMFRSAMWNQSVPDELRGRLAGVELLSYSVGPMAGNVRASVVAQATTVRTSIVSGGLLCVAAVGALAAALPAFRRYDARTSEHVAARRLAAEAPAE